MHYYTWPCGMFDGPDYDGEYTAMRYRPMPCTPSGDVVAKFKTKAECDAAVEEMNNDHLSLDEAKARFSESRP